MTDLIDYSVATSAQKLGDAVIRFGLESKLIPGGTASMTLDQMLVLLDEAGSLLSRANELVGAGRALGNGITVDIFWERQGFYFVHVDDLKQVSTEYPSLDACVRYLVLRGYTIREVHRTRRSVLQPTPPAPPRPAGGAE